VNPRHSGRGGEAAGRPEATALGADRPPSWPRLVPWSALWLKCWPPARHGGRSGIPDRACLCLGIERADAPGVARPGLRVVRGGTCRRAARTLAGGRAAGPGSPPGAAATTQNHAAVGRRWDLEPAPESRSAARGTPHRTPPRFAVPSGTVVTCRRVAQPRPPSNSFHHSETDSMRQLAAAALEVPASGFKYLSRFVRRSLKDAAGARRHCHRPARQRPPCWAPDKAGSTPRAPLRTTRLPQPPSSPTPPSNVTVDAPYVLEFTRPDERG